MRSKQYITLSGRDFIITRMDEPEQFEVESILLQLLGPAVAAGVGVLVDNFASQVVKFLRDITGQGASFDLAKLESLRNSITTRDGKVEVAWTQLLESIESLSGDMLQRVVPAATDRFDHHKVMRLFELAVFGRVLVVVGTNKTPARLETYRNISDVSGRDPRVKYALLFAALAFNYLDLDAPEDEPEDDGGEAPTE